MKPLPPYSRIIGLDLHPRHFGYAVVEVNGTPELFDWGVSRTEGRVKDSAARRIRRLIKMWQPSFIVLEDLAPQRARRARRVRWLISLIKKEACRGRISSCIVDRKWVSQALDSGERLTKDQQASILAQRFPVLQWKLPAPRGPGASEDYRMGIFDAVALALGYVAKRMRMKANTLCEHIML
jgi:hypothetical protein